MRSYVCINVDGLFLSLRLKGLRFSDTSVLFPVLNGSKTGGKMKTQLRDNQNFLPGNKSKWFNLPSSFYLSIYLLCDDELEIFDGPQHRFPFRAKQKSLSSNVRLWEKWPFSFIRHDSDLLFVFVFIPCVSIRHNVCKLYPVTLCKDIQTLVHFKCIPSNSWLYGSSVFQTGMSILHVILF